MNIIDRTQSICPKCRKPVEAFYIEEEGRVFFLQKCEEHGEFKTLASENAEDFKEWIKHSVINIPPRYAITEGDPDDRECPLHCGTCRNHLQTACCVLIDITQRCNQHCPYCFAQSGDKGDAGEPTLEEIEAKYDFLLAQGEDGREFNIQLSGGEPTVRDDLPEIIKMAKEKGFSYVQINSNGRRLAEEKDYAKVLKEAGASVIFMQFDGTDDDIYMKLRGEPLLAKKTEAIRNCEKAGLPVTLVPTIVKGVNDHNIGSMMDFIVENVNIVKGVHFQPASFFGRYPEEDELDGRITMFGLLRELERQRPEFKYSDSMPISTGHTLCCFYSTYIKEPDGSVRCTLTKKQRQGNISCCDVAKVDELEVIKKDRDYVLDKWDVEIPEESCCCEETEPSCCCEPAETACCCEETEPSCCCEPAETACCCEETEPSCCCEPVETACCCEETEPSCCCEPAETACCCEETEPSCCCEPAETACCCEETEPSCCCGTGEYSSSEEIKDLDEFLTYYKRNTFTVTGMAFQDITNLDAERLKRCRVVQLTDDNRIIPFCAYNTIYR